MLIRKATINDAKDIMIIYDDAKNLLKKSGSDQWQNGYPNMETIIRDVAEGNLYVTTLDQEIIGTAYISALGEPTYHIIDGEWLNDDPYLVIHRIATKRTNYNKGVAKAIISYAEELAISLHIYNIRVDTHFLNVPMQGLLTATGFKNCGIIYLTLPEPFEKRRLAYHKTLSRK